MSSQATPAPRTSVGTPRTGTPRSLTRVGSIRPPSRLRAHNDIQKPASETSAPPSKSAVRCPNPECGSLDIVDVDGQQTCTSCGATVVDANIVSEVTFGESASGAAVVQGGYVGQNQRHARTLGPGFKRGAADGREASEGTGREEIRKIANFLNISADSLVDQASSLYKAAVAMGFILGRRVRTVAAVCLYAACRSNGGESTVLLIDFAEAIKVNVFKLGEVFQDLRRRLYLDETDEGKTMNGLPLIEVENLIQRYCMKLELRDKTQRVANDAVKILRRMKRDWIVTGRQPSGLCGACIILAARMNNFRRTSREIAYIVKVTDITVGKRLEEFKRTDSAALSVDDFRTKAQKLKKQHDPPAFYEAREKERKKRKRLLKRRAELARSGDTERLSSATPDRLEAPITLRRDAEGFAIPAKPLQIDPALENVTDIPHASIQSDDEGRTPSASPSPGPWLKEKLEQLRREKPKRDRQLIRRRPELRLLTRQDLLEEDNLEQEIDKRLTDEQLLELFDEVKLDIAYSRSTQKANEARDAERRRKNQEEDTRRREIGLVVDVSDDSDSDTGDIRDGSSLQATEEQSEGLPFDFESETLNVPPATRASTIQPPDDGTTISSDPYISPSEFDSDDEVKYCRLSEEDVKVKELIWVNENEQWLREQQAKQLRRAIMEARGLKEQRQEYGMQDTADGDQEGSLTTGGRRKKRKIGKMGDGAIVREGGAPKSAAEAVGRMVKKRSKGFSKFINKGAMDEHLKNLYEIRRTPTENEDSSRSVSDRVDVDSARQSEELQHPPALDSATKDATSGQEEPADQRDGNDAMQGQSKEVEQELGGDDMDRESLPEDQSEEGDITLDDEQDMMDGYEENEPEATYDEEVEVGFDDDDYE